MYSWVFRHRARLRVIYGLAPASEALASASTREDACAAATSEARDGDEPHFANESNAVKGPDQVGTPERLEPGNWARRNSYVVMRPMRTDAA